MNSTLELKPLLDYIMDAAAEIVDAEAASIMLQDEHTDDLRFAAANGDDSQGLIGMVVPIEGSIAGLIVAENRAIIISDVAHDPRHFKNVDQRIAFETRDILGVPMRRREALIGVLEVLNKRQGHFNDEDLRHITILASQAAVAIENARLVTATQRANEDLARSNKLKSDFIAITSHELRTPLGVVLGYASLLRETAEGEMVVHSQRVLTSALHLRKLIDDMTNLRYVQIERSELTFARTKVHHILQAAYADVIDLVEAKDQILSLNETDVTFEIVADSGKLEMALWSILNNSVKFTPEGGEIVLSVLHPTPQEVWIEVRDTGIGMEEQHLEPIFDQFYQVEDTMTREHGGMGLGLAIARAIVERHDGRIWAQSPGLNRGSTFTIALPVAGPSQESLPG
jgi:signal transduction histidine kinase